MPRKLLLIALLSVVFAYTAIASDIVKKGTVSPLTEFDYKTLSSGPQFAMAEICTVRHDLGQYWLISQWLTGAELYKSYQDPSLTCTDPYPFTVQSVEMVIYFGKLCTLFVSVDVESADLSTPACPFPGNLLTLSSEYQFIIPSAGLYLIAVPLDTPEVVNGPYFSGFYISNIIDTSINAGLVTDSPGVVVKCVSYNIWDTAVGYIDLADNAYYDFPGRLLLFSHGMTGGSGQQPEPSITLLKPAISEIVTGPAKLWASENSGSTIIDSVRFDQKNSTTWSRIGRDADGSRAIRNGVDPSGTGEGFTLDWNYSLLTEGTWWLKAAVYDTLGRMDVDSHQVSVDPTPPDLTMTEPTPIDSICLPMTIQVSSVDENITQVAFYKKFAATDYTASVITLNQANYGNVNGNAADGNHIATGEFGDYYCGPVAGAIAVKYWFDKGFIYGMREGSKYISIDTVVERLAANMRTRANKGTYDDLFFGGLQQYTETHGNELVLNCYRSPDYYRFRTLFQEKELLVVLAISGTPGAYLVASKVSGLIDNQGRFPIQVSNPMTGTAVDIYMRNVTNGAEIYFNSVWHPLDMIITVDGYSHTVTRDLLGTDNSSAGGWNFNWGSSNMTTDSLYFITAISTDATGRTGMATNLVRSHCPTFAKGDYDGNGSVNIGDALYLINAIYRNGLAPVGGIGRADANCDTLINLSDVIYMIQYLYGAKPAPCY
jgi:hypothetical protein